MTERERIAVWAHQCSLNLTDDQIAKLLQHVEMVREVSSRMNLMSKNDLSRIIERHVLDSLYALTVHEFSQGASVADLGSGAGFPGVPIAIARRDLRMDLVESRKMKSLFLKNVIDKIGLANAQVINDRWENINHDYDIVLARAVYDSSKLERKVLAVLPAHGVVLHYVKLTQIDILRK